MRCVPQRYMHDVLRTDILILMHLRAQVRLVKLCVARQRLSLSPHGSISHTLHWGITRFAILPLPHCFQTSLLPPLPPHARYLFHENVCYDWGTFGWLLMESGHVDYRRYRYFFFINSSVRGPYMPPYARVRACHHPAAHLHNHLTCK